MKKSVERRSEEDLLRTHDVRGKIPGWIFRIQEKSASHWKVKGLDVWGRRVVIEGSDPNTLLSQAEAEAQRIYDAQSVT